MSIIRKINNLTREVNILKAKLCKGSSLFYPDFDSFPLVGNDNVLYVDETNGDIYIWNGAGYIKPFIPDEYKTMLTARFVKPINVEFTPSQTKVIAIELSELGGLATSSDIVLRFTKSNNFTVTYDNLLTSANDPITAVANTFINASLVEQSFFYELTITDVLSALDNLILGITITAGTTIGSSGNMSLTLLNGTGGASKVNGEVVTFTIVP